jgi:hypothetical protein
MAVAGFSNAIKNSGMEIMVNDPSLVDQEMVSEMLDWIGENGPYARLKDQTVDIRFANQAFLKAEWKRNGGKRMTDIYAMTTVDIKTRKIIVYMPIGFDWEGNREQTHLMHEIVHNQQFVYYKDYNIDCHNDLEYEAYMLALMWFEDQGFDDESFVEDRLVKLDSYADCS